VIAEGLPIDRGQAVVVVKTLSNGWWCGRRMCRAVPCHGTHDFCADWLGFVGQNALALGIFEFCFFVCAGSCAVTRVRMRIRFVGESGVPVFFLQKWLVLHGGGGERVGNHRLNDATWRAKVGGVLYLGG